MHHAHSSYRVFVISGRADTRQSLHRDARHGLDANHEHVTAYREIDLSHRIDYEGIVYDLDTGERIGVVDKGKGGIVLDEDVYRTDGRYDDTADASLDNGQRSRRDSDRRLPPGRRTCD